jgi:gliding motility-associated-like protein
MAKDASGCTASSTANLTALLSPVFSLGNDTALCNGQTVLLGVSPSAGEQYLWQDNSTSNNYFVTTAGIYSLTIKNLSGCSATKSVRINFTSPPVFSLGHDIVLCDVEPLTLQPSPVLSGDYLWNTGSHAISLPVNISGTYWLNISDHGCAAQQSILVTFKPTPVFNLGADTVLCEGQTLFFDESTPNATYTWQDGSTGPTFTVTGPGRYAVQVDENGCGTASAVNVDYTSKPVLSTWTDTAICLSQKLVLDVSNPQSTYIWQDGSTSPIYSVSQAGVFSVDVTNGCGTTTNTTKVSFIPCDCRFFVPNAFTPNRDGHNDLFFPDNPCLFSDYEMRIYNRWGQLVFTSKDISIGWDGNLHGIPQPLGTYVWMISYKDGPTKKTSVENGTVLLLR